MKSAEIALIFDQSQTLKLFEYDKENVQQDDSSIDLEAKIFDRYTHVNDIISLKFHFFFQYIRLNDFIHRIF